MSINILASAQLQDTTLTNPFPLRQSIRRVAFRSAVSASRTLTSTTRATPFASQITRSANVAKPLSVISARFFTQTGRFANEEKAAENTELNAEDAQPTEAVEKTEAGSSGT